MPSRSASSTWVRLRRLRIALRRSPKRVSSESGAVGGGAAAAGVFFFATSSSCAGRIKTIDIQNILASNFVLDTSFSSRGRNVALASFSRRQLDAIKRQNDLADVVRSEEHTSELQSLRHLVC